MRIMKQLPLITAYTLLYLEYRFSCVDPLNMRNQFKIQHTIYLAFDWKASLLLDSLTFRRFTMTCGTMNRLCSVESFKAQWNKVTNQPDNPARISHWPHITSPEPVYQGVLFGQAVQIFQKRGGKKIKGGAEMVTTGRKIGGGEEMKAGQTASFSSVVETAGWQTEGLWCLRLVNFFRILNNDLSQLWKSAVFTAILKWNTGSFGFQRGMGGRSEENGLLLTHPDCL